MSSAQKTAEVQSPPGDTVSCLRFSPESMQTTFLAATSWDNRIRIWEVQANGSTIPKAEQMHQGPVFGACWSTVSCTSFMYFKRFLLGWFENFQCISRQNCANVGSWFKHFRASWCT